MNKLDPSKKTAVLIMAFGGPESHYSIRPFVENVLCGRKIPEERFKQIEERYFKIGGRSPLLEITEKQAMLINKELGDNYKVFIGMRFWHPFIKDAVKTIKDEGFEQIIGLCMTPYYSTISTGAYKKDFDTALKSFDDCFTTAFIPDWYKHPSFIEAVADKMKQTLKQFDNKSFSDIKIVFSVHSIPEKIITDGDPYLFQINETIKEVDKKIGPLDWELAFQSKGGGQMKWLEPEVEDVLLNISKSTEHAKPIMLVPIGFVSDHVETLYDIDIEINKTAENLNLNLIRAEALNVHPLLIDALTDTIKNVFSSSDNKNKMEQ